MSTSVQHNNGCSRHVRNIFQHGLKVQLAAISLVVAILLDVEPGVAADGVVVAPGGVGQVDVLAGVEFSKILSTHAKRSGAGDGLRVGVSSIGNHVSSISKSQFSSLSPKPSMPNNRQVLLV